jgi:hypothetical protein
MVRAVDLAGRLMAGATTGKLTGTLDTGSGRPCPWRPSVGLRFVMALSRAASIDFASSA